MARPGIGCRKERRRTTRHPESAHWHLVGPSTGWSLAGKVVGSGSCSCVGGKIDLKGTYHEEGWPGQGTNAWLKENMKWLKNNKDNGCECAGTEVSWSSHRPESCASDRRRTTIENYFCIFRPKQQRRLAPRTCRGFDGGNPHGGNMPWQEVESDPTHLFRQKTLLKINV